MCGSIMVTVNVMSHARAVFDFRSIYFLGGFQIKNLWVIHPFWFLRVYAQYVRSLLFSSFQFSHYLGKKGSTTG